MEAIVYILTLLVGVQVYFCFIAYSKICKILDLEKSRSSNGYGGKRWWAVQMLIKEKRRAKLLLLQWFFAFCVLWLGICFFLI